MHNGTALVLLCLFLHRLGQGKIHNRTKIIVYKSYQEHDELSNNAIQGVEVPISLYPHVALIVYKSKISCGGSVISDHVILTAAHCLKDLKTIPAYDVYLGSSVAYAGAKYKVCKILTHKEFLKKKYYYAKDIAMLMLRSKINFGKTIKKIDIAPKKSHWRNPAHQFTFASFGMDKHHHRKHQNKLKATTMLFVPSETCSQSLADSGKPPGIPKSMFCMFYKQSTSVDCRGNAGTGVIWKYKYLVGIISRSKYCGSDTTPLLDTDVLFFRKWIRRHVKYLESMSVDDVCPLKIYKDYKDQRWVSSDHHKLN